ncbi:hypothetical protein NLJ89_g11265 [Agrocybe chaxingu]|uniref:Reverse transcriptase Ty1/copia-type domain-containing protein n=1 Tax=Agrocybe chaxingu TaxID=84603 RepID=A0A9W8JWL8_9AGAR|nr:hypothetical protein NLJ89_g11265 [Agrocybe chaxingu]
MQVEWGTMQHREVFTLADRPAGKNIVKPLWTFGYKYDAEGEITKRKARLVAKGYTQIPGLDFDQTYASVARLESMRMTAAVIACKHLKPWQIDYVAAYLNSDNKFEVYMEQPWPFVVQGKEDMVLRVNKTVYGMMQGAYDWEDELSRTYKGLGYYQSRADPCVRHRLIDGEYTLTCTYTDDVLGGSSSPAEKERAIGEMEGCYEVKRIEESGGAKVILGMAMTQDSKTGAITLSQRVFAERMLERFGMSDCNPRSTPLPCGIELSELNAPRTDEDVLFMKDKPYREALGCIMWLQVGTRPDLSFAVNLLSRYQANPGPMHWKALQHVLAYIKGTIHYKITYDPSSPDGLNVSGYSDSDYAGDPDTMRSTSGYVFTMAGGPVAWSSKRQPMTGYEFGWPRILRIYV